MRAQAIALKASDVVEFGSETNEQKSLMTPARRAALDALEREFAEYLSRSREH